MLDFVRKYFNVVVLLVICLSLKGCKKSHILDENEEHVKDIAENFTDALIAQNDDKIISYVNETADEYYEHVNISSLVKPVLNEQPKEISFLLAFVLEYEINDCAVKNNNAVATVKFVNMKEQILFTTMR
jgi:nitrogen-specific signal transduction histidine kinase